MISPRCLPPLLLLLASSAPAQGLLPLSVADAATTADYVVSATVRSSRAAWTDDRTTIRTFVALHDLEVHQGTLPAGELVLRFDGGEVGDDRIRVAGMPVLQEGRRYLLFVSGNGRHVSPIAGFNQGAFEIRRLAGRETLVDLFGRELVDVHDGGFVYAAPVPTASNGRARVAGPQVASIDHTVVAAAPDVEQRERLHVQRRTATPGPLPELPASTRGAVTVAGLPVAAQPPASAGSSARTPRGAHPVVLDATVDPGTRLSVSALLARVAEARR